MAKLKRVLAGALSLCMVGSLLTACGDSSSNSDSKSGSSSSKDSSAANSSSADSSTADSSSAVEPKAERKDTSTLHGKDSSDASKNKIQIYCWNTEFKLRFDAAYAKGGKYQVETKAYKDEKGKAYKALKKVEKAIEDYAKENFYLRDFLKTEHVLSNGYYL